MDLSSTSVAHHPASSIEPLETRIAPAGLGVIAHAALHGTDGATMQGEAGGEHHGGTVNLGVLVTIAPNGKSASFKDVDGDKVTVKTTKGKFTAGMFDLRPEGLGAQLEGLDLTDPQMAKTNLTFQATPQDVNGDQVNDGDSRVNVGAITAAFDLGKVKIPGDLAQIDCGSGSTKKPALKSLSVLSLGALALATQDASTASLDCDIAGGLAALKVTDDLGPGGSLAVAGKLGKASIGGNVDSTVINVAGSAGKLTVTGDLVNSAFMFLGKLGKASIGGSLHGSSFSVGGNLKSAHVGGEMDGSTMEVMGSASKASFDGILDGSTLKIKGGGSKVTINAGLDGAAVDIGGNVRKVTITGALDFSAVTVGGNLTSATFGGNLNFSSFEVVGNIKKAGIGGGLDFSAVEVGGNAGEVTITGSLNSSALSIGGTLGEASIDGDLDDSALNVLGTLAPAKAAKAIAIGKLTIGGHVATSAILAGYDSASAAKNADVSMGSVTVEGDWSASNLVAGIADSTHDGFGHNDTLTPDGNAIVATIASLTIKGTATGSAASGDFFGITAELIKKVKIHDVAVALTSAKDDLSLDAVNNDFRLVEV